MTEPIHNHNTDPARFLYCTEKILRLLYSLCVWSSVSLLQNSLLVLTTAQSPDVTSCVSGSWIWLKVQGPGTSSHRQRLDPKCPNPQSATFSFHFPRVHRSLPFEESWQLSQLCSHPLYSRKGEQLDKPGSPPSQLLGNKFLRIYISYLC